MTLTSLFGSPKVTAPQTGFSRVCPATVGGIVLGDGEGDVLGSAFFAKCRCVVRHDSVLFFLQTVSEQFVII